MKKLALVLCLLPSLAAAHGDALCGERSAMLDKTFRDYGETQAGAGISGYLYGIDAGNATLLVELWRSPETGTWTIVLTGPTGKACVLATGQAWDDVEAAPDGVPG